MDIGLSSEQLSLRATVRDILRTECPPDAARQAITDPERWRTLWKTVVDLGWTELAAPDGDYGPVELAVVLEECGAAIAPIPMLSSVGLAAGALRAGGLDSVLTDIAGGVVATLAVHPRKSRLPGAPMTLRGGRLRGRAVAVPNLSRAELIVTLARSDDSVVVAVARCGSASGVTALACESTDPAQPVADVEIDAEPLVTAPVKSGGVESALTSPLVAAAADLVGVAGAALRLSVEHAKARRQFGAPIGAFQGIKHALADNHVSVERARSLTYAAAAAQLADPEATPAAAWTAAALAKAAAGDAAVSCARTAVQVHGALGQTWEHDAHLYVRRAWQGAAMLGDSRALYHEVGRRFAGGAG
ncbi:acyl-CoA dehydrogenase family protein [Mycobacterium sp. 852002-51057_SCH5723018]|uniref:acyl-CoA dehydrogenase family protein n=1 Tax=Mycobacterium sp. 852002-51057_SCH5723018 TaxID=1834094 RepID=UPI0007FE39EE|nr:acyl-CoA dehydrogenase family protein [Mycobacterium sp. 852002-51057_SCH5723018]OBG24763.1 acyl-CoA dehydrogenase [Mycobacterium sp. 852002-51057_SCH5723018]